MVAIPTNYKMGTGLAATIMGQQAGLEAEQTGLQNLYKAMQMPQEALKSQESAMLMQNPEYLQQKTSNTLIELRNKYSEADFQENLNAANRVRIKLDAAAGDPAKEQQIVEESLAALKIDPNSEFAQYARKDPRGALTKFIQGVEVSLRGTAGAKHLSEMEKQTLIGQQHMDVARLNKEAQLEAARIRAADGGAGGAGNLSTDKEYNKQLKLALAGDENAKRWVNTYIRNKQITNLQYGAPAFQFGQNGGGQMTTKGATAELPFPEVDNPPPKPVTVEAGGKVYSFPNQAAADSFKQRAGIK